MKNNSLSYSTSIDVLLRSTSLEKSHWKSQIPILTCIYIYIDKMILNGNDNPSRKKHFQIEKTKAVRCGNRINPPFSSLRRRLDAGGWVGTFLARATWQVMVGTYPISPQFFNGLKKRFSEGLNGWTNADFKNEGPALFRHLEYD